MPWQLGGGQPVCLEVKGQHEYLSRSMVVGLTLHMTVRSYPNLTVMDPLYAHCRSDGQKELRDE
jgi:hypothetical protein